MSGRKRDIYNQMSAEEEALSQVAKEAEMRAAAKRATRAEAREIRMREIERQQREEEEEERDKSEFKKPSYSTYSSRRISDDSSEDCSQKDYKKEYMELDIKFKKAMMNNAQLDNEKQSLNYRVNLLNDQLEELQEAYTELNRILKERNKDLEHKKKDYAILEKEFSSVNEQLKKRDALIEEHGLIFICDEVSDSKFEEANAALVSKESVALLQNYSGSLEDRLSQLSSEKKFLEKQIRKLNQELEDEKEKRSAVDRFMSHSPTPNRLLNGNIPIEIAAPDNSNELRKELSDCRFKLKKSEQEVVTLTGNVVRLESQVKRLKQTVDNAEKVEEEMKAEKRRMLKEMREIESAKQELELERSHLLKRLDKVKTYKH